MLFVVPWWVPVGGLAALLVFFFAMCFIESRMTGIKFSSNAKYWLHWLLK